VPIPEPLQSLTTTRDFIRWGSSEFLRRELCFGHGFASALDEARYLVLHALSLPWDWPDDYLDTTLIPEEREKVIAILRARVESRQPAAYLTRESWFCGLRFYVDERVLVPRSPMAELIASHFEPWTDADRVTRILDLCCGSGCIAIASRYYFPEAEICAADISAEALEVVATNLEMHDLVGQVEVVESDLFTAIRPRPFDVIVCNPPYVDSGDMAALAEEFRHEPELGLRAGEDGLALVDRILAEAAAYLDEQGVIFIEVGNSQPAMEEKYPFLPMTWIDFEYGGGVCCIRAADLADHQDAIDALNRQTRAVGS
jgi:ribosomal protein L3 glutamine methyltransferase